MKVKVHVNRYLNKYFKTTGEIEIDLSEGCTVSDLIHAIHAKYGVDILRNINSEVEMRRYYIVAIDKRLSLLNDKISGNENEIKLIPPISGG